MYVKPHLDKNLNDAWWAPAFLVVILTSGSVLVFVVDLFLATGNLEESTKGIHHKMLHKDIKMSNLLKFCLGIISELLFCNVSSHTGILTYICYMFYKHPWWKVSKNLYQQVSVLQTRWRFSQIVISASLIRAKIHPTVIICICKPTSTPPIRTLLSSISHQMLCLVHSHKWLLLFFFFIQSSTSINGTSPWTSRSIGERAKSNQY